MTAVKSTWKPYPAYKPSGAEWLGEVPEQWEVKRIRHVALLKSGESITASEIDTDGEYPVYGGNGLRGYTAGYSHDGHYALIGRQGALCGNINYARGKFWASEHAVVVRPLVPFETVWMGELLRAMNLNQYSVSAAQPGLSVDTVSALKIPVPHQAEQRAIASFLDRETGKIDRLVAKNRELIEKLKEERAALISRAVTRGLNPNAKLKPTGVEWLGDVPEHWGVKRLKLATRLTDRKVEADEDNPLPYIGMENIESWTGRLVGIDPDTVPTGTANTFKSRHTLFGKLRPYLAKACNPTFDGLCSTELLVLEGIEYDRRTLLYLLLSDGFVKMVDSSTYGSKMPRANWDFIGNCTLPVPPLPEQRAIAEYLDRETAKIDRLAAKVEEAIGRLQEYRAALITAAVTGKIDAREAGALEYPEAAPALLKAAESGASYGRNHTDKHGPTRTGRG